MSKPEKPPLLIMHKKSCTRPEVKEAVKGVRNSGQQVEVFIPWTKRDMRRAIKKYVGKGAARIIAGGGDGTLNAVVNGLMKKGLNEKVSLGVFPLGTANDFARGISVPADNLEAALELACTGAATPIDVGRMNGKYFINVASGGFGSEITATTPQDMKKALGGTAYTLMGIAKVSKLKPYLCKFTAAGEPPGETAMLVMAVGNSRYAGGAFDVAPKADLTDGLLDIAVLSEFAPGEVAKVASELSDPFNETNQFLLYRQKASFSIESDRPLHINLDGEPVVGTRFDFDISSGALSVVMGPKE
ncbi:MAG: lipid kinase YegS [Hyphomicrobiales bacterium]